jgi:hypothetical protein
MTVSCETAMLTQRPELRDSQLVNLSPARRDSRLNGVTQQSHRMSRGFQAFTRLFSLAIQSTDSRAAAALTGS